ncbi:hypothetical protein [Streptomyces anulatus]|uniref:hypothetical protein n=1 Tax=Streptomyces anulatus TaxID=1892 RepID=UPI001C26250E|nr:hypothetical protein [Streptomyces anulatus]
MPNSTPTGDSRVARPPGSAEDRKRREPTVRERQHLKHASGHRQGHLPDEVSARLVEAMLAEEWIYREDGDGYVLEPDEALLFQGGTAWRITPRGRWSALPVWQRELVAELGASKTLLARDDAEAAKLAQVRLVEGIGDRVGLTDVGRVLVHAFGAETDAGRP